MVVIPDDVRDLGQSFHFGRKDFSLPLEMTGQEISQPLRQSMVGENG
jgi:hypothetical protein